MKKFRYYDKILKQWFIVGLNEKNGWTTETWVNEETNRVEFRSRYVNPIDWRVESLVDDGAMLMPSGSEQTATKRERDHAMKLIIMELEEVRYEIAELCKGESKSLDNWPDTMQETARYKKAEKRKKTVEDMLSSVDKFIDSVKQEIDDCLK